MSSTIIKKIGPHINRLPSQFAHNNTLHASIQTTSFFSNYLKLDLLSPSINSNLAAEGFVKQLFKLQTMLKLQPQFAQEAYKTSAGKFWNELHAFKIGNKMCFLWRSIMTKLNNDHVINWTIRTICCLKAYEFCGLPSRVTDCYLGTSRFSCFFIRAISRVVLIWKSAKSATYTTREM